VRALGDAGGEVWFKVDAGTKASIERIMACVSLDPALLPAISRFPPRCATQGTDMHVPQGWRRADENDIEAYLDADAAAPTTFAASCYGIARPSSTRAVRLTPLTPWSSKRSPGRSQKGLTVASALEGTAPSRASAAGTFLALCRASFFNDLYNSGWSFQELRDFDDFF